MEAKKNDGGPRAEFHLAPCRRRKSLVGIVAVVAVGAFTFLVFGPAADHRATTLAGQGERDAGARAAVTAAPAAAGTVRLAGLVGGRATR